MKRKKPENHVSRHKVQIRKKRKPRKRPEEEMLIFQVEAIFMLNCAVERCLK